MGAYRVDLADGDEVQPDSQKHGWWIDGAVVTVRGEHGTQRIKLPTGKPRVAVQRLGGGRCTLIIGSFTAASVAVTGPTATVNKLYAAVL